MAGSRAIAASTTAAEAVADTPGRALTSTSAVARPEPNARVKSGHEISASSLRTPSEKIAATRNERPATVTRPPTVTPRWRASAPSSAISPVPAATSVSEPEVTSGMNSDP